MLPETGAIPTRITNKLLTRIDDHIEGLGFNQRYRSQWVRQAVVSFYKFVVDQNPRELAGTINLFCSANDLPGPKTMLRTTYRSVGRHKAVVESSREFLTALAAIENKLEDAPVSKQNPKKSRTDIIIAACSYYLNNPK